MPVGAHTVSETVKYTGYIWSVRGVMIQVSHHGDPQCYPSTEDEFWRALKSLVVTMRYARSKYV